MGKTEVSLSEKVYRYLLYFYPAPYRRQYGVLMLQLFKDIYNEGQRGPTIIVFWFKLIPDIIKSVVRENIHHWTGGGNMERTSFRPFGVLSFIVWVLGSGLVFPLYFFLVAILINLAGGYDGQQDTIFVLSVTPLTVISVFVLQWCVLRHHIVRASRWIWGNISALLLCVGFIGIISRFFDITITQEWLASVAAATVYGTFVGLAQWYVLRSNLSNVFFWIILNICALLSGLFFVGGSVSGLIVFAFIITIHALFTGATLLWRLRVKQASIHI